MKGRRVQGAPAPPVCQAASRRLLAMARPNAVAAMSARVTIHMAARPGKLAGHQGNTKPLAVTCTNAEGGAGSTIATVTGGGAATASALGVAGAGDETGAGACCGRSEKAWVRRRAGSDLCSTERESGATEGGVASEAGATLAIAELSSLALALDCAAAVGGTAAGVGVAAGAAAATGNGRGGVGMGWGAEATAGCER